MNADHEAAGQCILIIQKCQVTSICKNQPSGFSHKGSFGLAIVNDQLMMVEGVFYIVLNIHQLTTFSVLTMYKKSGAKGTKHPWTSSTTSISTISYLMVWCYQHTQQWQFQALECVVTQTTQFTLICHVSPWPVELQILPILCAFY